MDDQELDFGTIAAQAGTRVRVGDTLSTVPPIDPSTTFTYDSVESVHEALGPDMSGYAYARNANPTVTILEQVLARLEGAASVVAFGSGMGAINAALLSLDLEPGDCIVSATQLYGTTRMLFAQLATVGINTRYVDVQNLADVEEAASAPNVRAIYFESIANPLLQVADIRSVAEIGKKHRLTSIIDNTFATPYLVRPLELGIDIVVHSATKYIAGHGDVLAGVVATGQSWGRRVRDKRTLTGAVLSPFDSWLTLRGVRTLPLRMERQSESAYEMATWLRSRRWVERVYYPGLPDNPDRDLAARQFGNRFGGMVAFDLHATRGQVVRFLDTLQIITFGTSLGDVESLIVYPPATSHRNLTPEAMAASGLREGLLRLSVGLESPRDLQTDLERAASGAGLPAGAVAEAVSATR
jgi:cystathionine beta-lyase/cystathionine gamma-synthase